MNAAKFKYGQQIVFLGILSFRIELEVYFAILLTDKHFAIQDI